MKGCKSGEKEGLEYKGQPRNTKGKKKKEDVKEQDGMFSDSFTIIIFPK